MGGGAPYPYPGAPYPGLTGTPGPGWPEGTWASAREIIAMARVTMESRAAFMMGQERIGDGSEITRMIMV